MQRQFRGQVSGHSGDELFPYSTGMWIELGLWRRNLFASVIVEFRVFVGLPVEILDFNLEFPGGPKGFERSFELGAARPSNRTGRFILVSAPPDAGNPRPGRCVAPMRADECLAAGDMEGEAVWLWILEAIEELLSEERPGDAEVH